MNSDQAKTLQARHLADVVCGMPVPTDFGEYVDGVNGDRTGTNISLWAHWVEFFEALLRRTRIDEAPVFDEVIRIDIDGNEVDLVTHRKPDGQMLCWHSALAGGAVKCDICDGGARVYLRET